MRSGLRLSNIAPGDIVWPRPWRAPSLGRGLTAQAAAVPHRFRRWGRGELVPQDPDDEPASALLQCIKAQRAAAPKPKRGQKSPAQ